MIEMDRKDCVGKDSLSCANDGFQHSLVGVFPRALRELNDERCFALHVAAEKPETLLHVVDVVGADSKLAVGHLVELSSSDDHKRGKNADLLLRSLKSLAANRNSKFSLTLAARCGQEHADLRSF